jgi:hypothetical protein
MKALLFLAALCGLAHAEAPDDFPYRAPIEAKPGASHYRFALPAAAYQGAARRDLGDLRVFNAAGEPVPYAFVPRESLKLAPAVYAAALFPLYGDPQKPLDTTTVVRVERNARGTVVNVRVNGEAAPRRRALVGYLLDASPVKQPLDALVLEWQTAAPFAGQARVEASDDLRYWRTLAAGSPVLHLEHRGATLERRRIELAGASAPYLRLSFAGVPGDFRLREARLELRPPRPEPEREWRLLEGAQTKTPGEWRFDSGGHFPVDRVRLRLPQPNTVVQVQVLARERLDDAWRLAGSALAYRLSRDGAEVENADVPVRSAGERYWLVRVDQKGGGIGAGALGLELGWLPHEVVFAARGAGPFLLAYGKEAMKPGALAISSVLPVQRDGAAAAVAERASVGAPSAQVAPPASPFTEPLRFARTFFENRDARKWLLWLVLVAGVGLLAWMALRLLHQVGGDAGKR